MPLPDPAVCFVETLAHNLLSALLLALLTDALLSGCLPLVASFEGGLPVLREGEPRSVQRDCWRVCHRIVLWGRFHRAVGCLGCPVNVSFDLTTDIASDYSVAEKSSTGLAHYTDRWSPSVDDRGAGESRNHNKKRSDLLLRITNLSRTIQAYDRSGHIIKSLLIIRPAWKRVPGGSPTMSLKRAAPHTTITPSGQQRFYLSPRIIVQRYLLESTRKSASQRINAIQRFSCHVNP